MNVNGGVEVRHVQKTVYMWGYLPGATTQRLPLLSPVAVNFPGSCYSWNDVCGGGCGFAMALSESGKLITWGSTNDLGQSYLTSGKHGETPEPFPLPPEAYIVKATAGWAHCVTVTDCGEVYTWGWRECIPSGKVFGESSMGISLEQDVQGWQSSLSTEQVSPHCQGSRSTGGTASTTSEEESTKRRRVSSAKQTAESSSSGDDTLTALPCLVTLNPGVRIASVAAGGRHTLALSGIDFDMDYIKPTEDFMYVIFTRLCNVIMFSLKRHFCSLRLLFDSNFPRVSDIGQVWGWGYGGEGQLGLGSRIRMVSSPHLVPCIDSSSYGKDRSTTLARGRMCSDGQGLRAPGSYVKGIACGGRHSVVITDAGALLTFGWGLYGQNMVDKSNVDVEDECGQGTTDDELSPTCISSLLGIRIDGVAAGLWHTVCTSAAGDVYVFGGNQFGQLGTGSDQAEVLPRLVDSPNLENMHAKNISCGSRHTALLTEGGKVFCWGWNKYGQLGLGDVIDRNVPSEVTIEGCVPKNVACGWWHTLLLA